MNQMTEKQTQVWKCGNVHQVGRLHREATRNPNKALRDQYATDKNIEGTTAWAIRMANGISSNDLSAYTDDVCDKIINVLNNNN
jgi:hypothetical protein